MNGTGRMKSHEHELDWTAMTEQRFMELKEKSEREKAENVMEIWNEMLRLREHLHKIAEAQRTVMYGPSNWHISEGIADRTEDEWRRYLDYLVQSGVRISDERMDLLEE